MHTRRMAVLFAFGIVGAVLPQLTFSRSRHPTDDISQLWWDNRVFPDDGREYVPPEFLTKANHIYHTNDDENRVKNKGKVCETKECKIIADEFLSSIDKMTDPCDDFYQFTCGGWSTKDVIPPSSAVWSRLMIFQNAVYYRVKGVLEEKVESNDILPVRQAKKWYQSCMDGDNLEKRGIIPMESIVMQAGGWPITMDEEEWDSKEYTWQKIEQHYYHLTGSNAFHDIRVIERHLGNNFGSIMIVTAARPLTEQEKVLKSQDYTGKDYDAYVKLVENVVESFVEHNKANVAKEKINKEAKEIVDFEKQLYKLEHENYGRGKVNFQNLTEWNENITDYTTNLKAKINFTAMIQRSFDAVNIEVDPSTEIFVYNVPYVKKLLELLETTPSRTIANYVHWKFVSSVMMYTTEEMRNELLSFFWQEFGIKERRPRWTECVIDMKMVHAASYVFVTKYFTETTKKAAFEMIKNIQNEMKEKIDKSNWLDDESKVIATEKINSMRIFFGFPDWYNNDTAVINHYKGITIGAEYFDNMLSYKRYVTKKNLKGYLTMAQTEENWDIDPITVNALYGPAENSINLPAADFQAPLFTPQLPNAVNYAVAGVIVGHEMGHGFDDLGIRFGKDGNKTELSEIIMKSFYQLADCFTDQYEEYYNQARGTSNDITPTDATMKKRRSRNRSPKFMSCASRSENMADTTGIQAVFQAYKKLNKHNGLSMALPGLEEYTDEQLFFLSYASVWCKVQTPEYEKKAKTMFDRHSPAKMRVIGSVSNTIDFARVFNCPKGSPMNPSNKCNIWEKAEATSKNKTSFIHINDLPWESQWKTVHL